MTARTVILGDGKYVLTLDKFRGASTRNGEPWQDFTGSKVMYLLVGRVLDLEDALAAAQTAVTEAGVEGLSLPDAVRSLAAAALLVPDVPVETEAQGFALEALWQFIPEMATRDDSLTLLTPAQVEQLLRRLGWKPPGESDGSGENECVVAGVKYVAEARPVAICSERDGHDGGPCDVLPHCTSAYRADGRDVVFRRIGAGYTAPRAAVDDRVALLESALQTAVGLLSGRLEDGDPWLASVEDLLAKPAAPASECVVNGATYEARPDPAGRCDGCAGNGWGDLCNSLPGCDIPSVIWVRKD